MLGSPSTTGEALSRYASQTSVAPERSRAEIERTLARYGCEGFLYGWENNRAVIMFRAGGKSVRFVLPLPREDEEEVRFTDAGRARTSAQRSKALDQLTRQRWRALALSIKAKLEAVESGIVSFEEEFLAHFVLPDGETVGERLAGDLSQLADSTVRLLPTKTS